jgi:hypothetical protein
MLCDVSSHERSQPHLLLRLPDPITCSRPKDTNQDITPLSLQLYKTSTLLLQENAYLCTKKITVISTFLYFFTEERLHKQQTTYEPVSEEECRQMKNSREIKGQTLTDSDGLITTANSEAPVYVYCCHWEVVTVINYILTPGYIYVHRDSQQLQSSLADITGCNFNDFHVQYLITG